MVQLFMMLVPTDEPRVPGLQSVSVVVQNAGRVPDTGESVEFPPRGGNDGFNGVVRRDRWAYHGHAITLTVGTDLTLADLGAYAEASPSSESEEWLRVYAERKPREDPHVRDSDDDEAP